MTALEPTSSTPLPDLPPPPREVTGRARRRSWNEAPVRVWMILAGLVLIALVSFTLTQVITGIEDRQLILHGTVVPAKVLILNGVDQSKRAFDRRETLTASLRYTGPDGKSYDVQGELTPTDGVLHVGDTLPLHLDPKDPNVWTDRTAPGNWWHELTVVWFLLPLLILTLLIAWWRRKQMLDVWRHGVPVLAAVVESKHSAMAPRSQVVRYTLVEGGDRRVFSTLIPSRLGRMQRGDELVLLALPGRPRRAIVAELYHSLRE